MENLAASFDGKRLVKIVKALRPGRLANVDRHMQKLGKEVDWPSNPAKLLDLVFGLDAVIAPAGPKSPQRFGFDVTLDGAQVMSKVAKLHEYQQLWEAAGIQKTAVVRLVSTRSQWGYGLLSVREKKVLVDAFFELLIEMDELDEKVQIFDLHF